MEIAIIFQVGIFFNDQYTFVCFKRFEEVFLPLDFRHLQNKTIAVNTILNVR